MYRIAQFIDGGNIDELALFRYLMGKILTDGILTMYIAMELEKNERKKFDGSLAKHQIRQYFPQSKNCTIRYFTTIYHIARMVGSGKKKFGEFGRSSVLH